MKQINLGLLAVAASMYATCALASPVRVPEPGALGLLAVGVAGIVAARLIKRKS